MLVAHAADPVGAAAEGADSADQLALLRTAGVIDGPRAHPAIAGALAAIVRPELCTLELSYSGKAMRGWVSYDAAALLLPARDDEDELRTLVQVHPTLLPEALARLVDLGPRPRASAAAAPVPVDDDAVGTVNRRWRLAAAWKLDDGTAGGAGAGDPRCRERPVAAGPLRRRRRTRLAGHADVRLAAHRPHAHAPDRVKRSRRRRWRQRKMAAKRNSAPNRYPARAAPTTPRR